MVELDARTLDAAPYATVAVGGQVHHARGGTRVRVLYLQAGHWRRFPIPATIDATGRFTAYVELGGAGTYTLRVVHVPSGATSPVVTVTIS